jgi:hypothetical protein
MAERPMVSERINKKPKEKGATPKEYRDGTGLGTW